MGHIHDLECFNRILCEAVVELTGIALDGRLVFIRKRTPEIIKDHFSAVPENIVKQKGKKGSFQIKYA
jgi:hypothetical protein